MTSLEMNEYLKSNTLEFLSENQLLQVMQSFQTSSLNKKEESLNGGWCTACFSGNYQDEIAQKKGCIEKLGAI
jgi:glutamine phosphoribosylpyrophosphate amidotransferase